jgi:hypothetical protein
MVRPGGKVDQLLSNVESERCGVYIDRMRCSKRAVGGGGLRAQRSVEKASATGTVVGAEGGSGDDSSKCGSATALDDKIERVCAISQAWGMCVRVDRAESDG